MTVSTVPQGAKQDADIRGGEPRVEASIWTERMVSALVNGVEGGKWYSLMDKVYAPKTLALAWAKVQSNKGAAGVDGQSVERFAASANRYLAELSQDLQAGRYCPQAVKRVDIPKGRGQTRPLGIPTVKDRIVQTAVRLVIEPIFEMKFLATSYGFRPERGCKDALREVDRLLKTGYTYVVDADLKGYFDSIPHEGLMERVETVISDGRLLALLRSWLEQDILRGTERWTPTGCTRQGAVISPLLSNLYLHPLDERMMARGYSLYIFKINECNSFTACENFYRCSIFMNFFHLTGCNLCAFSSNKNCTQRLPLHPNTIQQLVHKVHVAHASLLAIPALSARCSAMPIGWVFLVPTLLRGNAYLPTILRKPPIVPEPQRNPWHWNIANVRPHPRNRA